jgi:hypothetical protein
MTPAEAVQMLVNVGGVPVLAHPGYLLDMETSIAGLVDVGLMGMEVYYANYSPDTVLHLAQVADRFGLIPCGGSDYHGLGNTGEPLPGDLGPPLSTVERLEAAALKLAHTSRP